MRNLGRWLVAGRGDMVEGALTFPLMALVALAQHLADHRGLCLWFLALRLVLRPQGITQDQGLAHGCHLWYSHRLFPGLRRGAGGGVLAQADDGP